MPFLNRLGIIGLVASLATPALATTYNAVTDFSPTINPNTDWSYWQANGTLLGSTATTSTGNLPYWYNTGTSLNGGYVIDNTTGTTVVSGTINYRASELTLDGQSIGASVRFLAPSAGVYAVTGLFQSNDSQPASHGVSIIENGLTSLFAATTGAFNATPLNFSFNRTLAAGDYLDFTSAGFSNGSYGSTGLAAQLVSSAVPSNVPEPTSAALFGIGLISLIGIGSRRTRDTEPT